MRVNQRDIDKAIGGDFAAFKRLERCSEGEIPVQLIGQLVRSLGAARRESKELRDEIKRLENIKQTSSGRSRHEHRQHWVYVFSDGVIHKVGITCNISSRLKTVQSGCATDLFVHSQVSLSSKRPAIKLERACHRRFDNYRQSGEWFSGVSADTIGEWLLSNKQGGAVLSTSD